MTDDPRDYEETIKGFCPDCGPCLIDKIGGKHLCGKCGKEMEP